MNDNDLRVGTYGCYLVYHNPDGKSGRHIRFFKGFPQEAVLKLGKHLEGVTDRGRYYTLDKNDSKTVVYIDKRGDVFPRKNYNSSNGGSPVQ